MPDGNHTVIDECPAQRFQREEREAEAEAKRRAMQMELPESLRHVLLDRHARVLEIKHILKMASACSSDGSMDDADALSAVSYAIDGAYRLADQLAEGLDDYALKMEACKQEVAEERENAEAENG